MFHTLLPLRMQSLQTVPPLTAAKLYISHLRVKKYHRAGSVQLKNHQRLYPVRRLKPAVTGHARYVIKGRTNMYTIKAISPSEASAAAVLAEEIWNEHFIPIIGKAQVDYMLEKFQSEKAISECIENGYKYYMIFSDNAAAGYCGVHPEEGGRLFLSKLYVKKDFRGRGLSRRMLENAVSDNAGTSSVYLTVNKHNDNTIAIYKHMGFKVTDAVVSDIGGGFVMDDYIMELKTDE